MKISAIAAFALGLTVSLNSHASARIPDASSSWDTILASPNVDVRQTALYKSFGDKGFFNACIDGANMRTIEPVHVCAQPSWVPGTPFYEGTDGSQFNCLQYVDKVVEVPLHQTVQTTCADWKWDDATGVFYEGGSLSGTCLRYNTVSFTLPTNPQFSVYGWENTVVGNDMQYAPTKLLFKKTYSIPSCKK